MSQTAPTDHSPVIRTSAGLRDAIFDELDAIRMGKSNPTRSNAVAKLASSIVETVRMEMEAQRHLRSVGGGDSNHPPVNTLGQPLKLSA